MIQCIRLHTTVNLPVVKMVFVLEPSSEACLIVLKPSNQNKKPRTSSTASSCTSSNRPQVSLTLVHLYFWVLVLVSKHLRSNLTPTRLHLHCNHSISDHILSSLGYDVTHHISTYSSHSNNKYVRGLQMYFIYLVIWYFLLLSSRTRIHASS